MGNQAPLRFRSDLADASGGGIRIAAHWRYKEGKAVRMRLSPKKLPGFGICWSGKAANDADEFLKTSGLTLFEDEVFSFSPREGM